MKGLIFSIICLVVFNSNLFSQDKVKLQNGTIYEGKIINIAAVEGNKLIYFRIPDEKLTTHIFKLSEISILVKKNEIIYNASESKELKGKYFEEKPLDSLLKKELQTMKVKPKKPLPQLRVVKQYNHLYFLGISFIGCTYAGAQFLQAYNKNKLESDFYTWAEKYKEYGLDSISNEFSEQARRYGGSAKHYKIRAWAATVISTAAFIYAIIPDKYQISDQVTLAPTSNGFQVAINF